MLHASSGVAVSSLFLNWLSCVTLPPGGQVQCTGFVQWVLAVSSLVHGPTEATSECPGL